MKHKCVVYSISKTQRFDGTMVDTETLECDTICNYHSVRIDETMFCNDATKGYKTVVKVCLPVNTRIKENDKIVIDNELVFKVVGVYLQNISFEKICEAVNYE